jgi:hypothetical protein
MLRFRDRLTNRLAAGAFLVLSAAALPSRAHAYSLGEMVRAAATDIVGPFTVFIVAAAYLAGFWLCFVGLWKMAQNADKGFTHDGAWLDGIMRIACGSLLVALPDTMQTGIYTFYEQSQGYNGNVSGAGVANTADCLTQAATADVVTCVARNVATNLVPVFVEVAFVMFHIVGISLVFHAILVLAKSHGHGSRGIPDGLWPKMIIGFLLCNIPYLMSAVQTTLGYGSGEILASGAQGMKGAALSQVPSLLSYTAGGTSVAALQKYQELIGWCFVILVMFGVISVWKGITHLRAFAEGQKQGTMGSGLVHILGGVMLANGKASTCFVMTTFVGGNGLGFCG